MPTAMRHRERIFYFDSTTALRFLLKQLNGQTGTSHLAYASSTIVRVQASLSADGRGSCSPEKLSHIAQQKAGSKALREDSVLGLPDPQLLSHCHLHNTVFPTNSVPCYRSNKFLKIQLDPEERFAIIM